MYHVNVFFVGLLGLLGGKPFFHKKNCFCKSIQYTPIFVCSSASCFNNGELEMRGEDSRIEYAPKVGAKATENCNFLGRYRGCRGYHFFGDIGKKWLERYFLWLVSEQQSEGESKSCHLGMTF